jgi:SgrR family transcriptional regulator
MKVVNYTMDVSCWLKGILEQAGIEVEMEEISFQDAVNKDQFNLDADLFVHGEIFEMNQSFSYFFFLKNAFSPLHKLTHTDVSLKELIQVYNHLPFEQWIDHHLKIEDYLIKNSLSIPLYYSKRQIPFSINLMNVEIKHFGYVALSKLWVKPEM